MPRRSRPIEAGQVFAELTVIETGHYIQHKTQRNRAALCRCSCGVEKLVMVANLHDGMSRSCGTGIHATWRGPAEPTHYKTEPGEVRVKLRTAKATARPMVFRLRIARPPKPKAISVKLKTSVRVRPAVSDADRFYKGVHRLLNGRFQARTVIDGKRRQLGTFDTQHEADSAYADALAEAA